MQTKCRASMLPYWDLCYRDQKKTVSREWLDVLDAEGLAWWWMDDGSISGGQGNLSTHSYTVAEVLLMQEWFRDRWGIEATTKPWVSKRTAGKSGLYLGFGVDALDTLSRLIEPPVVE